MVVSMDLRVLANKLEKNSNDILIKAASQDNETFDKVSHAIAAASTLLEEVAEDMDNNNHLDSLKPELLDEMAALASSFYASGNSTLMKQASVLDEILLSIAAPKNAMNKAKKISEDEINKLREVRRKEKLKELYQSPKEALDKMNLVEEQTKAVEKQVRNYRPLEAPLQTRYSPNMPGNHLTRITDGVYQDVTTGEIFDYEQGYTTTKGNKIPGTSIKNQTADLGDNRHQISSIFQTRESLMGRYSENSSIILKKLGFNNPMQLIIATIAKKFPENKELINAAIEDARNIGIEPSLVGDALSKDLSDVGYVSEQIVNMSDINDLLSMINDIREESNGEISADNTEKILLDLLKSVMSHEREVEYKEVPFAQTIPSSQHSLYSEENPYSPIFPLDPKIPNEYKATMPIRASDDGLFLLKNTLKKKLATDNQEKTIDDIFEIILASKPELTKEDAQNIIDNALRSAKTEADKKVILESLKEEYTTLTKGDSLKKALRTYWDHKDDYIKAFKIVRKQVFNKQLGNRKDITSIDMLNAKNAVDKILISLGFAPAYTPYAYTGRPRGTLSTEPFADIIKKQERAEQLEQEPEVENRKYQIIDDEKYATPHLDANDYWNAYEESKLKTWTSLSDNDKISIKNNINESIKKGLIAQSPVIMNWYKLINKDMLQKEYVGPYTEDKSGQLWRNVAATILGKKITEAPLVRSDHVKQKIEPITEEEIELVNGLKTPKTHLNEWISNYENLINKIKEQKDFVKSNLDKANDNYKLALIINNNMNEDGFVGAFETDTGATSREKANTTWFDVAKRLSNKKLPNLLDILNMLEISVDKPVVKDIKSEFEVNQIKKFLNGPEFVDVTFKHENGKTEIFSNLKTPFMDPEGWYSLVKKSETDEILNEILTPSEIENKKNIDKLKQEEKRLERLLGEDISQSQSENYQIKKTLPSGEEIILRNKIIKIQQAISEIKPVIMNIINKRDLWMNHKGWVGRAQRANETNLEIPFSAKKGDLPKFIDGMTWQEIWSRIQFFKKNYQL